MGNIIGGEEGADAQLQQQQQQEQAAAAKDISKEQLIEIFTALIERIKDVKAKVEVEAKEKELSEDEARKLLSDRVGEADLEIQKQFEVTETDIAVNRTKYDDDPIIKQLAQEIATLLGLATEASAPEHITVDKFLELLQKYQEIEKDNTYEAMAEVRKKNLEGEEKAEALIEKLTELGSKTVDDMPEQLGMTGQEWQGCLMKFQEHEAVRPLLEKMFLEQQKRLSEFFTEPADERESL